MRPSPSSESGKISFLPREHGATAMLLSPFVCSAILVRSLHWAELAAFAVIFLAFAAKDPFIAVARQKLVWKQQREEAAIAAKWLAMEIPILVIAGTLLLWRGPLLPYLILGTGAAAFGVIAVFVNVKNKQRSEWFQVASAIALTSTSLLPCLAAQQHIPRWGWLLWILCALQATAGIFVVHARLDARIAAKQNKPAPTANRNATAVAAAALWTAAIAFGYFGFSWVAVGLAIAGAAYFAELRRQKDAASLQMPLAQVGRQSLTLSVLYGVLIIAGLWSIAG
ncbi:MAG: YwiC-like family protein [Bryobacteraceae bacterium]